LGKESGKWRSLELEVGNILILFKMEFCSNEKVLTAYNCDPKPFTKLYEGAITIVLSL
jgi:hypothetical protein